MRLESDEDNVQKVDTREFPKGNKIKKKVVGDVSKLIFIHSNTILSGHNKIWDDLTKCREEFLKYKKSNPLYNRKSLLTIKR